MKKLIRKSDDSNDDIIDIDILIYSYI